MSRNGLAARRPVLRRAIAGLVLTAVLAFLIVGLAAVLVARSIARDNALAEAERSADTVGNDIFLPDLPAALTGDTTAVVRLNAAVGDHDNIVRVKVWERDGKIVYSNDPEAIGRRFPLDVKVTDAIDHQASSVDLSNLDDPENDTERAAAKGPLVEVYEPLTLKDGRRLAFEMYTTESRVLAAESQLTRQIVPFALLGLLVMVLAQLPVAVSLLRRVGRAQEERGRLLRSALTASDRERRSIASDLHDGIVQDLAAVGYTLGAVSAALPENTSPQITAMTDSATKVVRNSVHDLRTLVIDIYPPDLTAIGLAGAIKGLATALRDTGVEVTVTAALLDEPSPEIAATLYRCAREFLANVGKHAKAATARIVLESDKVAASLLVEDDGVGLPSNGLDRRTEGHFGLALLRDNVMDLGGTMQVTDRQGGGVRALVRLPRVVHH
ncbi:MAG TPA: histidine kinase [Pseudonocardiaceae bacterium]|nr:histidine kinase [Pseudonocardiaceae bacterium]